jgi:putative addiction module component (TIGR02574 family)
MESEILKEALKLSIDDKLRLIEDVWDSIYENPEDIPVSDEQKKELDLRLENYYKNPGNVIKWEVLRQELLGINEI